MFLPAATGKRLPLLKTSTAKKFPDVWIKGYVLDSLLSDTEVDATSVKKLFGLLDGMGVFVRAVVLNAADQGLNMKIFENPVEDFMRVINTNVVWNYVISECAAARMKEKGGGSIVFINSNTAYRAIPDRIAYEASKGGQLGMMRGLALDLGKYGIRERGAARHDQNGQMGEKSRVL